MLRFVKFLLLNVALVAGFTTLQASGFDWGVLRTGMSSGSARSGSPSHK